MQQTHSILTLTLNPSVDKSALVAQVMAEHKLRCEAPTFEPGGGGINAARAVHKLGGRAKALYLAGGFSGQLLEDLINQENLNHQRIAIEDWTRENLTVYEQSSGQQYRFGMPGPTVTEAEWQQCLEEIQSQPSDFIVASGSLPPEMPGDAYAQLARLAKEQNRKLIVDTSGPAFQQALEAGVYLIKPNLRELSLWADQPVEDETHLHAIVTDIVKQGLSNIVMVSLGAGGALCVSAEQTLRLNAPAVPIQSKVGAGDSMVAGMVFSLACGHSLEEAARYGVAAGTAAVMTPGSELCRLEDVEKLYPQITSS